MTVRTTALAVALVGLYLLSPALPQAAAADGGPAFGFWSGFVDFWTGAFKKQSGVVLVVLGLAVLCLFIITRAKWKK